MYNNIFQFATKELSQDAIICWLLNWVRFPDHVLFQLATELFALFGISSFDIYQDITIKQQIKKADIVVALHKQKTILVIEDKTCSSEHDGQIKKYKEIFSIKDNQTLLGNTSDMMYEIKTVYLKTGFCYDDDKSVIADVKITANELFAVVSNERYHNKSEILDNYVDYLRTIIEENKHYADGFHNKNADGIYYVSYNAIAQHELIRSIFPELLWEKSSDVYKIVNGSSSGRPFSTIKICEDIHYRYSTMEDRFYSLSWRLDTNSQGPYLSLRIYDHGFDKSDELIVKKHVIRYDLYVVVCRRTLRQFQKDINVEWSDIKDKYTGSFKDSSLLSFRLADYLDNWADRGEELKREIRLITEMVLKARHSINY